MTPRSYLYVPGDAPEKLARAGTRGADAVIFDLEDAVPVSAKERARAEVRRVLDAAGSWTAQRWVRINANEMARDIDAVLTPALTGVVLPKAEPDLLTEADALLTDAEQRCGLAHGQTAIIALVESARGVLEAAKVAAAARVVRLGIGEADLIGELGIQPGPEGAELAGIRTQVVLASAAAGIAAPIGPVETRLSDDVDLVSSTRALLRLGFRARTAIHPRQIQAIHEAFAPTSGEIEQARRTIATLGDRGVTRDETGQMIDAAVLRAAYEILSRAEPDKAPPESQLPPSDPGSDH